MKIYPSLISSDLLNLKQTITTLDAYCDGYHIDVMDDHFVPNLTWGPPFVNAISAVTHLPLQVHLMVDNPQQWVERLELCVNDSFIFHIEAIQTENALQELVDQVKQKKYKVGLALNPKTNVQKIHSILPLLDEVLIMSVEPGFSGQAFMPEVTGKVDELKQLRDQLQGSFNICMDGGINDQNITELAKCGVDIVAVAAAIFFKDDPVKALQSLYEIL